MSAPKTAINLHPAESPEARFQRLVREWREATGHFSSSRDMAMHRAYQEIIGMGVEALPLLLREMEREPDHLFWALRAITGQDPVPAEHRGRIAEMARDWIEWARQQGIRW